MLPPVRFASRNGHGLQGRARVRGPFVFLTHGWMELDVVPAQAAPPDPLRPSKTDGRSARPQHGPDAVDHDVPRRTCARENERLAKFVPRRHHARRRSTRSPATLTSSK